MGVDPPSTLSASESRTTSEVVDLTHPYYLSSSDSPGMNLINVTFDGSSYGNWKRGVLISLSAKNKLDFINGKVEIPSESSPLFGQWKRCNDMVIAWLLNSLSKDISESVIYSQTTVDLWSELEERYGQPDGSKLFQLQRELNNISQGSNDVATYYTKLKRIWDQLKVLNTFMTCSCECKCGAKTHNQKMNEDMKLIQFLMGLNEVYCAVRGHILMMKPLPSTNQAYSIILHDESQREVQSGKHVSIDSVGFFSANKFTTPGSSSSTRHNPVVHNQGPAKMGEVRDNIAQRGNSEMTNGRNNLYCTYCKRTNHVRANCYRLIGYPQDFKFTKGKKNFSNAKANAVEANEAPYPIPSVSRNTMSTLVNSQGFSKEQCENLIHMFQSVHAEGSNHSGSYADVNANMAGIAIALHLFSSCYTTFPENQWIIDTGASQHMTYDKSLLNDIKQLSKPISVRLPNAYRVKVYFLGSVNLSSQDLSTVRINRKFGDCAAGLYMLKDNTSIANNSIKFSNIQPSNFSLKCSLKSENGCVTNNTRPTQIYQNNG
ncbi:hypothetical protein KY290_014834 [Solanum tuberosum]|uniref:Retrotransposon Copia-like N-terminal domain-containing protein n=1 Tax=Solanum tuberosum TaxID=4113 RepID=A0ABQ7VQW8_SOLTU|nr:hypothetical protein KY290_014834 [Solanum tuberosum]